MIFYLAPAHARRYAAQSKAKSEELSPLAMHISPVQLILEQEPDFSSPPEPGRFLDPRSPYLISNEENESALLNYLERDGIIIRIKGVHHSGKTTLFFKAYYRFLKKINGKSNSYLAYVKPK